MGASRLGNRDRASFQLRLAPPVPRYKGYVGTSPLEGTGRADPSTSSPHWRFFSGSLNDNCDIRFRYGSNFEIPEQDKPLVYLCIIFAK